MILTHPNGEPHRIRRLAHTAAVVALLIVFIGVPLWLVVVTSGKSQGDALNPSLALPKHGWHFGADYSRVFFTLPGTGALAITRI